MIPLNAPVNREAEVEIDGGRGVICPMCHANRSAYSHPHHQYVRQRAAVAAGALQEAQMNGDSRPFHAGLATACALIMAGCAAYRQTDSQVVAREPGDRFLGHPSLFKRKPKRTGNMRGSARSLTARFRPLHKRQRARTRTHASTPRRSSNMTGGNPGATFLLTS